MAKKATVTEAESLASVLALALISAVAVLIQIRDGKDSRDINQLSKKLARSFALPCYPSRPDPAEGLEPTHSLHGSTRGAPSVDSDRVA